MFGKPMETMNFMLQQPGWEIMCVKLIEISWMVLAASLSG